MDPKLFEKAVATLRATVRLAPQSVELRRQLAELLESAERFDEAASELQTALDLAPGDVETREALGRVLRLSGKNEESAARLSEVLRADDKQASAQLEMARVLLALGRRDKATKHYELALDLDPTLMDAELEKQLYPPQEKSERPRVARTFEPNDWDDDEDDPLAVLGLEMEKPDLTFEGVGGLEALKEDISLNIIYPFQHPEIYAAYGKKVGGGILLYGPPGCGKTFIARATAGQCGARFIAVGLEDVLDMWMGQSERKLHAIFEAARRSAPTVVFFDELDALAGKRSDMSHSPNMRAVVNQMLSELDGVKASNEGLLIMGATNSPWHIDSAFRRPGRFDKIIFVPPPDARARVEILKIHCQNKPTENLNLEKLASRMKGFSGADIAAVVEVAAEQGLRETLRTGKMRSLTEKDFAQALKQVRASTQEWLATAKNYALYANEAGIYDPISAYLNKKDD